MVTEATHVNGAGAHHIPDDVAELERAFAFLQRQRDEFFVDDQWPVEDLDLAARLVYRELCRRSIPSLGETESERRAAWGDR